MQSKKKKSSSSKKSSKKPFFPQKIINALCPIDCLENLSKRPRSNQRNDLIALKQHPARADIAHFCLIKPRIPEKSNYFYYKITLENTKISVLRVDLEVKITVL
jgi:hypothetical protein